MALTHVKPGEIIDVQGHAAGTVALVKTESFEAIRLAVRAGARIPPHEVSGDVTLHCLEGRVELTVGSEKTLSAGQWIYIEGGTEHAISGVEDSILLLTIVFDRPGGTAGHA